MALGDIFRALCISVMSKTSAGPKFFAGRRTFFIMRRRRTFFAMLIGCRFATGRSGTIYKAGFGDGFHYGSWVRPKWRTAGKIRSGRNPRVP